MLSEDNKGLVRRFYEEVIAAGELGRIADGRIVEHWGEADTVGMLAQMGVNPFGASDRPR